MNLQRIKRLIKAFLKPSLLALMRFAHRHRFINNSALACLRLTPRLKARLRALEFSSQFAAEADLALMKQLSPYEMLLYNVFWASCKLERTMKNNNY